MNRDKIIIVALAFVVGLIGFVGTVQAQRVIGPGDEYNPEINPADFTTNVTNPYFSLPVGQKRVYEAETADGLERVEILIPGWTRNVAGVETLIYWDRVYLDDVLVEDTRDYLTQHKETGDVWYFGEHVDNYEDGELVDHEGAWLAGEDDAQPGIWMLGNPQVGDKFRSEYRAGEAEDESEVLSLEERVTTPYGTFTDCIKHLDGSPLFVSKEHKYYCKGIAAEVLAVGLVGPERPEEEIVELVAIDPDGALSVELPSAYANEGVVAPITCHTVKDATEIATAKLIVEYNATDGDIGVHGQFDDSGWSELCIYAPNGKQIVAVRPQAALKDLTMGALFFESREPPVNEFAIADLMAKFPEGEYAVRALSYDGTGLIGSATFSHDIPTPPAITSPTLAEDEESVAGLVVSTTGLVIEWADVTKTIRGNPVTITGYEVIITKVKHDDPNGFSRPVYDVHVPADMNSLPVPDEFLEPDTVYELEVLALEESGNQTISVGFFKTR